MNLLRSDQPYAPTNTQDPFPTNNIMRKRKNKKRDNTNANPSQGSNPDLENQTSQDDTGIIISPNTSFKLKEGGSIKENNVESYNTNIEKMRISSRKEVKMSDLIEGKEKMEVAELI